MERRENISPPLLPPVSKETIDEMRMDKLNPLNPESFRQVGVLDNDPLLIMLTKTVPLRFTEGGLRVYLLLAREAQKTGKSLPPLGGMPDFSKIDPTLYLAEALIEKGPLLKKKLDGTEIENTPPSFQKFRPENPDLMDYLEEYSILILEEARGKKDHGAAILKNSFRSNSLYTYQTLRNEAEKERMKGLGL